MPTQKQIEDWLRNEYKTGPDWVAYPDKPHDNFEGYAFSDVIDIIQAALDRFNEGGKSSPV
jgi:hypothetical protein